MRTYLGKVLDCFNILNSNSVIIVDADCSSVVKFGDCIEIVYPSGKSVKSKVLDGIIEEGSKFNSKSQKVSAIRIENFGFEANNIRDCKVYLT